MPSVPVGVLVALGVFSFLAFISGPIRKRGKARREFQQKAEAKAQAMRDFFWKVSNQFGRLGFGMMFQSETGTLPGGKLVSESWLLTAESFHLDNGLKVALSYRLWSHMIAVDFLLSGSDQSPSQRLAEQEIHRIIVPLVTVTLHGLHPSKFCIVPQYGYYLDEDTLSSPQRLAHCLAYQVRLYSRLRASLDDHALALANCHEQSHKVRTRILVDVATELDVAKTEFVSGQSIKV